MIHVLKADNTIEPFNEEKLRTSFRRAKVPKELEDNVVQHITSKTLDTISTSQIFDEATDYLGKSSHPYTKATYRLKQSIMELGPTGYPFEDFISEMLQTLGYSTKIRQILMGKCINHEIDVVIEKDGLRAVVEAKFHNALGSRSEVQTALYTKARFDDIKDKHNVHETWLVTNTKVTDDAAAYAACVGMKVISWDYPDNESLRDLIERANLHPITILTTLPAALKNKLLEQHIVRCKHIHENPSHLDVLPLSQEQKQKVLEEIAFICGDEHAS